MGLSDKYARIPLSHIKVERDERQRREIDVSDLLASIKQRGVIQPIIVERTGGSSYRLVAGERRYTASKELGLPDIPARLVSELSSAEAQIIELEENIKRQDLPWQDECLAVERIHKLYASMAPVWSQSRTADAIGISQGIVAIQLRVAEELRSNPAIQSAAGYRAAYNIIARKEGRAMDDAMSDLLAEADAPETPATFIVPPEVAADPAFERTIREARPGQITVIPRSGLEPVRALSPAPESILNVDFTQWVTTYTGLPFSFIHMDFPYGIGLDKSDQAKSAQWGGYEDSAETYWRLLHCLAANKDRLFTQSSHFMFWLSMEYYIDTMQFFSVAMSDFEVQRIPLVWHKTDNRGILSDPNRRPRNVLEFALIGARGDRKVAKPVANGYGAPSSKEIHQSEKPEPMLRHFFQLFVDENTRMLDPTCGSGTSLRAAESLGACQVLGLEINPDWAKDANVALRKFRTLRQIERKQ